MNNITVLTCVSHESVKPGLSVSLCKRRSFIDCVSEEENSQGILPYVTSSNKKDGENRRSNAVYVSFTLRRCGN